MCTTTTATTPRRSPLNPAAAAFTPPNKINSSPPPQQTAPTTTVIPSKNSRTHFPTTNTKLIYYSTPYPYTSSHPFVRFPYHHRHIPSSPHPLYGPCRPLRLPPPLSASKGSAFSVPPVVVDDVVIKDAADNRVEKWVGGGEGEEVRVSRRRRLYPTPPRMRRQVVEDGGERRNGKTRSRGRNSRGWGGGGGDRGGGRFGCRLEWQERKKINSSIGEGNSTTTATVMIRNIPNKLSRVELIELVGEHCKKANAAAEAAELSDGQSEFDFLYLPFCFKRLGNRGYAFVNFTAAAAASRFCESWNGLQWAKPSKKVVVVTQAMIQGKEELKKHFQSTVFRCNNDEFLPVELTPPNDGSRSFDLINTGTRCATKSPWLTFNPNET